MFQGCLIQIDLQNVFYFVSLILSNTFLCNFLLVFWLATLAFLLVLGLTYFCIFKSIVLASFFLEILSFGFCLVNSEGRAYLVVDHRLVYSYVNCFCYFSV